MKRFRITRIAAYFYHRRYTLSFSWRGRWSNRPRFDRFGFEGGWSLVCGPLILEKNVWPLDDNWGKEVAEIRHALLRSLMRNAILTGQEITNEAFAADDQSHDRRDQ